MTVILSIGLTGLPKTTILNMMFEQCGLAGFEFERTAEEVRGALRTLNSMMKEWPWSLLPYNQPTYGVGLPEEISNIPGDAEAVVAMHLALCFAPAMGAALPSEQRAALAVRKSTFMGQYAVIPDGSLPGGVALGSGKRFFRSNNYSVRA